MELQTVCPTVGMLTLSPKERTEVCSKELSEGNLSMILMRNVVWRKDDRDPEAVMLLNTSH